MYALLLLTTTLRFADMIYLLVTDSTDLPFPILLISAAVVLYGIYLLVQKFTSNIRLKQLMAFFLVQTGVFAFNIIYTAINVPLQIGAADTLLIGTFLDIIINCSVVYFCLKQMRGGYATLSNSIGRSSINA
ncbi:hypothetical protein LJC05_03035 [Bacteroides sp. OttesenSCG-928-J23]|nr:hypothetical protein [Bacteroides sp. OttesenSCG-928-J23]